MSATLLNNKAPVSDCHFPLLAEPVAATCCLFLPDAGIFFVGKVWSKDTVLY